MINNSVYYDESHYFKRCTIISNTRRIKLIEIQSLFNNQIRIPFHKNRAIYIYITENRRERIQTTSTNQQLDGWIVDPVKLSPCIFHHVHYQSTSYSTFWSLLNIVPASALILYVSEYNLYIHCTLYNSYIIIMVYLHAHLDILHSKVYHASHQIGTKQYRCYQPVIIFPVTPVTSWEKLITSLLHAVMHF